MSGMNIPITNTPDPMCPAAGSAGSVIVIGGDARQVVVIRKLTTAGYRVLAVGLEQAVGLPAGVTLCRQLCHALTKAGADGPKALILPLPASRDGVTVSCPLNGETRVTLAEVTDAMAALPAGQCLLLGGRLPETLIRSVNERCDAPCVADYYDRADVQIKNARISAEGALMTAMELTDTALLGSRAAVVGYGRIGHFLADMLVALGVRVTVCARRSESLAAAAGAGCHTLRLSPSGGELSALCRGYDVIYNTVPFPLFGTALLEAMSDKTLFLDLASAPGGVEPEAARRCLEKGGDGHSSGVCPTLVRAPSLPGRYAPTTAGQVIADAILALLEEGGKET